MPYTWTGDESTWAQAQKIASLRPDFRSTVNQVLSVLRQRGWQPKIVYGWRSLETQARLKAAGQTTVDFSFHNNIDETGVPAALAVDVLDSRYGWNSAEEPNSAKSLKAMEFFRALGLVGKAFGLYWGGDWVSFKDWGHLQAYPNSYLGTVRTTAMSIWSRLRVSASSAASTAASYVAAAQRSASSMATAAQQVVAPSPAAAAPTAVVWPWSPAPTGAAAAAANAAAMAAANRQRGYMIPAGGAGPGPGSQFPESGAMATTWITPNIGVPQVAVWAGGGLVAIIVLAVLVAAARR